MISLYEYSTNWYLNKLRAAKRVLYAQIHLTGRCQYRCSHCYFSELGKKSVDADFDVIHSRIAGLIGLARKQSRFLRIDFTGGDPLLSPILPAVLRLCKANRIVCGLKCNPDILALSDNLSLANALDGCSSVSLSLDGTEEFHDSLRGRKGTFELALKALRKANDLGLKTRISMTISKDNKDMIKEVFSKLAQEDVNVDAFTFARLWSASLSNSMLGRKDLVECFDSCCSFYSAYLSDPASYTAYEGMIRPKIQLAFKEHLWLPYLESRGLINKELVKYARVATNSLNCSALHQTVVIDPDNKLFHCRKITSARIDDLSLENLDGANFCSCVNQKYTCRSCINRNVCFGCPAVDEIMETEKSRNRCPFYCSVKQTHHRPQSDES